MNDKLIMENYLLLLKNTTDLYVHGILESSNESSRLVLKECLDNTLNSQENTYNEMTKYGWYQINNIERSQIETTVSNLQSKN